MKIKETFIVEKEGQLVKLHYCTKHDGTCPRYYIEHNSGFIHQITFDEAYELFKD